MALIGGRIGAKWDAPSTVATVMISVIAHVVFVFIAAFIVVGGRVGGAGESDAPGAPVEMAVISEAELASIEAAAGALSAIPTVPDLSSEEQPADPSETTDRSIGDEAARDAMEISDVGPLSGGGELSAGGGLGLGGSGGGGASFFGVEASGTRFAFLVDVSGSMEGKRMISLREQLRKSIAGLAQNCSFVVVPFSSGAQVMGDRREWRESSDSGKKWANTLVEMLAPSGGTEPLPGFEIVFSMRPRPDAIYFMTDGEFNEAVVDRVAALNRMAKVPIHCICFGQEGGGMLMKTISKASKGTYRFVPE